MSISYAARAADDRLARQPHAGLAPGRDLLPGLYRLARLERQCGFYHVLAISIPPLAVAWLVLYHHSDDQTSLAVVSIVALLGLAVLVWISRQVFSRLATLKQLAERLAETASS